MTNKKVLVMIYEDDKRTVEYSTNVPANISEIELNQILDETKEELKMTTNSTFSHYFKNN